MSDAAQIEIHPVSSDRWPDLVALFGERGACAGCWCMWARREAAEFKRGTGDGNRSALRKLVRSEACPGLLAYAGDEPIGWIALAPRTEYPRLTKSKLLAPVDDQPVWSVTCFFIRRDWRRRGLATYLLNGAAKFAASNGARIIEGYPTEPSKRSADAFVWTGVASTFESAGFSEVARRSASRPIMRKTLGAARAARGARAGAAVTKRGVAAKRAQSSTEKATAKPAPKPSSKPRRSG